MNKLLTKIVGVVLGTTMAVGVGVGVAVNSDRKDIDSQVNAAATTYQHVFNAKPSTGENVSLSSVSWTVTATNLGNYNSSNYAGVQVGTSGKKGDFEIETTSNWGASGTYSGKTKVTEIRLWLNAGSTTTLSTLTASVGGVACTPDVTSITKNSSAGSTWSKATKVTFTVGATNTGKVDIHIAHNSNLAFYVCCLEIDCEAPSTGTLDSISLSGTYPTTFTQGDAFSHEGMTVTANYVNPTSTNDVTSEATFTGYDMDTAGNQTVTVSYGGKSATYGITVNAVVPVSSVSLNSNAETLDIGGKTTLTATVSPNDATNKEITWESSDESVATVNEGVVTALSSGTATITVKSVSDATKSASCAITVNGGDVTLNYTNTPFNNSTGSSTVDTKTVDGITYQNVYGQNYSTNSTLEFSKNTSGYLGNTTGYSHYISKVVIVWYKNNNSNQLTMYEGTGSLPSTNTVSASNEGLITTYTFTANTNQYFNLKVSATSYYAQFYSLDIYFGNEARVVSSIAVKTAPTKTSYLSGQDFDPAGLVITLTYSTGTPATENVTYSNETKDGFSFSPATITAAGNVTISYAGKTCNQAVTLATVSSVDSVASHPDSVYVNGSIPGSAVTLNVTYSNGDTDVVNADHVKVDTSKSAPSVLATAWYTEEETGNLKATFNVAVLNAPVSVSDSIDLAFTGVSGSSYVSWSNKTSANGAKYSGNNAGGNSSIQLNDASTSGLYTTVSAGKLYSVSVTWNSNTSDTRKISVYGSNTAFSSISTTGATKLGDIVKGTSTSVVDDDFEYDYLLITGDGKAVYIDEIVVTWKIPATDNPMTANPTLTLGKSSVSVGKTTTLTVSTTPADSDEVLNVVSADPTIATVTGSGKSYTVTGVAVGSTTITVTGKQSGYTNSIGISVVAASKTYEDKILTPEAMGIDAYDKTTPGTYSYDDAEYSAYYVMKSGGFQFHAGDGYITNAEELYSNAEIKSVTLIMKSNNTGTAAVFEGTSTNPSTAVSPVTTYAEKGVNTYQFNGTSTYFKVMSSSGTLYIEKIIVELADDANSVLEEARLAALAILTDLSDLCGAGKSGVVTQSDWNSLTADLNELDLSSDAKSFLRNATRILLDNLSQGGAEIENAMAHYDACVQKFGYTDVLGIANVASANPSLNNGIVNDTAITSVVVIISVISLSTLCGYFLLRKRKEQ